MLTTQNFKRAQKHAKILGTKVGDASGPSNLKNSTFTWPSILTVDLHIITRRVLEVVVKRSQFWISEQRSIHLDMLSLLQ